MTEEQILLELQDILQRDEPLTMDMKLSDIEEWDSLAIISTMAFLQERCNSSISLEQMDELETVTDILIYAKPM